MPDFDSKERLTLAAQLRVLTSRGMPEEDGKTRLSRAFRHKEIIYQPNYAVAYHDARIDWTTGRVVLPRLPRQPFVKRPSSK